MNEKIYNNKDIEIKDTTFKTKKSIKDKIIDNLRFIIPQPQINKYNLVEFTTEQNKKSYIDIQIGKDNVKYLKYISIDEKNVMQKDIISIRYKNIKFRNIDANQKPYIEIERKTDENIRMFSIDEVTTYTFHLPSAEIETLKNEM